MKTKSASPLRAFLATQRRRLLPALLLQLAVAVYPFSSASAQTITSAVPGLISYQGKVSNASGTLVGAGTPVNRTVIFRIWSHSSNSTVNDLVYSEQQTVTISEGEFSVLIGQGTAVSGTPLGYSESAKGPSTTTIASAAVFGGASRFLGVTIDDGTAAADPEVSPRQQLVTSAFAFRAKYAESVGSNGNSTLTVTDAGNVGIGYATPGAPLTFAQSTGEKIGLFGSLNYGIGVQASNLQIHAHSATDDVTFGYGASVSMTETMRIKGNGNVGIGTNNPTAKLDVNGAINVFDGSKSFAGGIVSEAGGGMINFGINDSRFGSPQANTSQGGFLRVNTQGSVGSNLFQFYARPNNGTGVTEVVSIAGNGNVGIGNPSPTSTLHVNGSITSSSLTTGSLNLTGPVATSGSVSTHGQGAWLEWNKSTGGGQTYLLNQRGLGTGGIIFGEVDTANTITETMRITPGTVKISNSAGTASLSVTPGQMNGTTDATAVTLDVPSTGTLSVWDNFVVSGNVGVGTTSPGTRLDVNGVLNVFDGTKSYPGGIATEVGGQLINFGMNDARFGTQNTAQPGGFMRVDARGTTFGGPLFQFIGRSSTTNTTVMTIGVDSKVGIGIASPSESLVHISGGVARSGLVGAYINSGLAGNAVTHGTHTISLRTSNSIWCGDTVIATSDARVKNIEGLSSGLSDLKTLLRIEVADFRYKDVIGHGNAVHKKVIAQQVESVFPQAVTQRTGALPDIYKEAVFDGDWIKLATSLKKGDRVRLIGESKEEIVEVLEVAPDRFRTAFSSPSGKVFVYGREVPDFRTVDYDAIAMLNVSATQELARENAALRAANAALEQRLAEVESKDRARDAKLASIEKLLQSASSVMAQPAKSATGTTQQ